MPVPPRRRHEIGEPVAELNWGEFDDAVGSRPHGLPPTTPPDPATRKRPAASDGTAMPAPGHGTPRR